MKEDSRHQKDFLKKFKWQNESAKWFDMYRTMKERKLRINNKLSHINMEGFTLYSQVCKCGSLKLWFKPKWLLVGQGVLHWVLKKKPVHVYLHLYSHLGFSLADIHIPVENSKYIIPYKTLLYTEQTVASAIHN